MMIGPCSECVRHDLQTADELVTSFPALDVIAVSPSPHADLEQFRRQNRLKLRTVSDPEGQLARRYNAAWQPRAYLLTPTGVLRWSQPGARPDLARVVREVLKGVKR
jgi:peroxiredoxin